MEMSDAFQFAVVKFLQDNSFSEIPAGWLTDHNSKCFWPPNSKQAPYFMRKGISPNPSWSIFDVTVESYCSTLQKARKKAEDYNYTTTEDENLGRGRRVHFSTVSSSSERESSESDPPPNIELFKRNSQNVEKRDKTCKLRTTSHTQKEKHNKAENSAIIIEENLTESQVDLTGLPEEKLPHSMPKKNQEIIASKEMASTGKENIAPYQQRTITDQTGSLELMSKKLDSLLQLTQNILLVEKSIDARLKQLEQNKVIEIDVTSEETVLLSSMLPLVDEDSLKNFDKLLDDNKNISIAFKHYVLSIGGKSAKDNITRILKKVFSNQLALKCSWLGQRNNIRVCDLVTMNIIKGVILVTYKDIKEKDFDVQGSEWFRLAKNRFNREEKKSQVQ